MANLYAFGRLAWNPNLSSEQIAEEWTHQTISGDPVVGQIVTKMLMQSWPAYVNYTGPLGMQTLTDITGSHYGPNVESSERNGWGQWHKADHEGVGFDRTVATGTGFAGQYSPKVAKMYESAATTSDNLLLFFHHEPYTYKLHDGKTIIQFIYDSHYLGAEQAANLVTEWDSIRDRISPALFNDVHSRLEYQAGHAIVWRDAIVQYFDKLSGIPDDKGRAGHFPGRLEAENARLIGYKVIDITPWEDASRGKAVSCRNLPLPAGSVTGHDFSRAENVQKSEGALAPEEQFCIAEWTYNGPAGRFNIPVQYFDLQGGVAHFTLSVNNRAVTLWAADADLPSNRPDGDNSTRYTAHDVQLKPGDTIRVEGTPNNADPADLDYIEVDQPNGNPVTFNK
jgi:alpha-glucuronidase